MYGIHRGVAARNTSNLRNARSLPTSFRGAHSASPESIATTVEEEQAARGLTSRRISRSWLWIPGSAAGAAAPE
ncbi:hypothetical protein S58_49600 [Bradyrhizobium oligotrophicum S58]|uniref:Uncharacterized protein n=1 Tax=Bradyrhizobium oligotrophicum S58 TaxID=1245469 RepID=M4ZAZ7_9BRAD|nr:hypothetical protein S58_49600 [Bradyrhizobium oligotrophicum S58]